MKKSLFKKELKKAFIAPEPRERESFLVRLRPRTSRRQFYLTQLGYIRKRTWIISFLLMVGALVCGYRLEQAGGNMGRNPTLLGCVSAVMPLLALIMSMEVSRSYTYGMDELEISTKYNLNEVLLARMTFLGIEDLALIIISLPFVSHTSRHTLVLTAIYLLVPYLMTSIATLEISYYLKNRNTLFYCMAIALMVSASYILLSGLWDLYAIKYSVYWVLLFCSLIGFAIYEVKMLGRKMEEKLCSLN